MAGLFKKTLGMLLLWALLGGGRPGLGVEPAAPGPPGTCPVTTGPIFTDTAETGEPGQFGVQTLWAASFTQGKFTPNWRRVSPGGDFTSFTMPLKVAGVLARHLEVNFYLPYIHNWAHQVDAPGPRGERGADFGGMGDIFLALKYQLVEDQGPRPAVAALFATGFPTGHSNHLNPGRLGIDELGTGADSFTFGFNLSKCLSPVVLYGNLWYSVSTTGRQGLGEPLTATQVGTVHPRDQVILNLAAELALSKRWVALLEFYSLWETGPLVGPPAAKSPAALLGVLPGVEYIATDHLAFALGVSLDLAGKNTPYSYTPIFTVMYAF